MEPQLNLQGYKNRHSIKSRVARLIWNVTWLLLARWTPERGIRLFNSWRIFLLRLFGAKIGKNCLVFPSTKVWAPWNLEMGDYASLGEAVFCYNVASVKLGQQATVSREAFLCAVSHDITSPIFELVTKPIVIESSAWVAARAMILLGVTVGEGAVVAAGSIVTKDVSPWTVVAGNPAKVVKVRVISTDFTD